MDFYLSISIYDEAYVDLNPFIHTCHRFITPTVASDVDVGERAAAYGDGWRGACGDIQCVVRRVVCVQQFFGAAIGHASIYLADAGDVGGAGGLFIIQRSAWDTCE